MVVNLTYAILQNLTCVILHTDESCPLGTARTSFPSSTIACKSSPHLEAFLKGGVGFSNNHLENCGACLLSRDERALLFISSEGSSCRIRETHTRSRFECIVSGTLFVERRMLNGELDTTSFSLVQCACLLANILGYIVLGCVCGM